jgi:hypothetical protein
MVDPAGVTHVLVQAGANDDDLSPLWPQDSAVTADTLPSEVAPRPPARSQPQTTQPRSAPPPQQRVQPPTPPPVERSPTRRDTLAVPDPAPQLQQPLGTTPTPPAEAAPPLFGRDSTSAFDSTGARS